MPSKEENTRNGLPDTDWRDAQYDMLYPVHDPLTGESRKLDFVIKGAGKNGGGHAQEITSKTASKRSQLAKEERSRDAGGVYVRDGKSLVHVDGISEIIRLP